MPDSALFLILAAVFWVDGPIEMSAVYSTSCTHPRYTLFLSRESLHSIRLPSALTVPLHFTLSLYILHFPLPPYPTFYTDPIGLRTNMSNKATFC